MGGNALQGVYSPEYAPNTMVIILHIIYSEEVYVNEIILNLSALIKFVMPSDKTLSYNFARRSQTVIGMRYIYQRKK